MAMRLVARVIAVAFTVAVRRIVTAMLVAVVSGSASVAVASLGILVAIAMAVAVPIAAMAIPMIPMAVIGVTVARVVGRTAGVLLVANNTAGNRSGGAIRVDGNGAPYD